MSFGPVHPVLLPRPSLSPAGTSVLNQPPSYFRVYFLWGLSIFALYLFILIIHLLVCTCVHTGVPAAPWKPEDGIRSSGIGVMDGCEFI